MAKHFRDLKQEQKANHNVAGDASDHSLVYCEGCGRVMEQGDCEVYDDVDVKMRCAFGDCVLSGNIAYQSLYGWDSYRHDHEEETAEWPENPAVGECYRPATGAS